MLADTDPTGPEAGVAAGHPATERRDSQRTAVGCCANAVAINRPRAAQLRAAAEHAVHHVPHRVSGAQPVRPPVQVVRLHSCRGRCGAVPALLDHVAAVLHPNPEGPGGRRGSRVRRKQQLGHHPDQRLLCRPAVRPLCRGSIRQGRRHLREQVRCVHPDDLRRRRQNVVMGQHRIAIRRYGNDRRKGRCLWHLSEQQSDDAGSLEQHAGVGLSVYGFRPRSGAGCGYVDRRRRRRAGGRSGRLLVAGQYILFRRRRLPDARRASSEFPGCRSDGRNPDHRHGPLLADRDGKDGWRRPLGNRHIRNGRQHLSGPRFERRQGPDRGCRTRLTISAVVRRQRHHGHDQLGP